MVSIGRQNEKAPRLGCFGYVLGLFFVKGRLGDEGLPSDAAEGEDVRHDLESKPLEIERNSVEGQRYLEAEDNRQANQVHNSLGQVLYLILLAGQPLVEMLRGSGQQLVEEDGEPENQLRQKETDNKGNKEDDENNSQGDGKSLVRFSLLHFSGKVFQKL